MSSLSGLMALAGLTASLTAFAAEPAAKPTATPTPEEARALRQARHFVEDLKDEADYRIGRARKLFSREHMAEEQKPEIGRALDRAVDHVQVEVARVERTLSSMKIGDEKELKLLQEELDATQSLAKQASDDIEAVRTHDDRTEATLQAISGEIEKISDRAESLSDKVDDLRDSLGEKADEDRDTSEEDDGGDQVYVGIDRHGHLHPSDQDRVHVGGSVEVKAGEKVRDAVAIGGDVTVEGEVLRDAVAVGGNVHVTDTGRVRRDGTAVGGETVVDQGGKIDGQKVSVAAGGMASVIKAIVHGTPHGGDLSSHRSFPLRVGRTILTAGIEFILFFLLGLLVVNVLPGRTETVARTIETRFWASSGFGALLVAALPIVAVLLCFTILGIPVALLLVFVAAPVVGFFGYVALALLVGKRVPSKVEPTRTALLAVGAAVVVAVGMIPIVGPLVWLLAAFPAIGAVVISRFGQEGQPLQPA